GAAHVPSARCAAPNMRVAVISTQFIRVPPGGYGGTELFCANLTSALVERGHDVTLFATGDSESAGELRWLFPHPNWPPGDQSEQVHVGWALEQIAESQVPYDAIQANSPFSLEIARQLGMPLVYTIHHVREPMLSALYADHPEVQFVAISRRQ